MASTSPDFVEYKAYIFHSFAESHSRKPNDHRHRRKRCREVREKERTRTAQNKADSEVQKGGSRNAKLMDSLRARENKFPVFESIQQNGERITFLREKERAFQADERLQ